MAESKRGKTIKENNNWTDEQYDNYLKNLSKRCSMIWSLMSEENKEKIKKLNRERAFKRRIDNINNFKDNFKNGLINNYNKYKFKIKNWKRDLLEEEFNELFTEEFLKKFYEKCDLFNKENKKNRKPSLIIRHSNKINEIKNRSTNFNKQKFIEKFEKIKSVIDENELTYLEDFYTIEESRKIRKSILYSKFKNLISDKYINIIRNIKKIKIEKTKKEVSDKFYGNIKKTIEIDGVEYESVSKASEILNINRSTLKYRLKSDMCPNYKYL